jgi:hypothetical protein
VTTIESSVSVDCAGGTVQFAPDGRVRLSSPGGLQAAVTVGDLAASNFVELWCGDGWGCFVGQKGKSVWYANPSAGELRRVLELARLDLSEGYDPGGLHRVEFVELATGSILIVHELGLALLGSDGHARWQQMHDQISAHFDRIDSAAVWFRGEHEPFGFDLADGRPVITS